LSSYDRIGLGWRPPLAASIFVHLDAIDVVEVIADNLFDASRRELNALRSLGREVPMAMHGVGLGLASVVPLHRGHLDKLARVVNAVEPTMWSEHLAFVRGDRYEIGHLAASPRNRLTVDGAIRNLARARTAVGESPALENIATLIDPPDSAMSESEWARSIAVESDSPLLLDLHNLLANALNFGTRDPLACLREFPLARVSSVHISGGQWIEVDWREHKLTARRLLDDHIHDVPDVVFTMLAELGYLCPQRLTVILERDGHYPEFPVLLKQLQRAREALAQGRQRASRDRRAHELTSV
jgi:uncharacterized protein (UPF0276 family)